jgi:hypothetical protein
MCRWARQNGLQQQTTSTISTAKASPPRPSSSTPKWHSTAVASPLERCPLVQSQTASSRQPSQCRSAASRPHGTLHYTLLASIWPCIAHFMDAQAGPQPTGRSTVASCEHMLPPMSSFCASSVALVQLMSPITTCSALLQLCVGNLRQLRGSTLPGTTLPHSWKPG